MAREGSERKSDPFRFWLPQREEVWKQAPWYEHIERQRRDLNLPFESLRQRKRKLAGAADGPPDFNEE
jgi:hypothetical protein